MCSSDLPQSGSALRRAFPGPWELYRLDPDGYRAVAEFEQKPDGEQQSEALGEGRRSVAFALRFRSPERTLTDTEVGEARAACIAAVTEAHAAELR